MSLGKELRQFIQETQTKRERDAAFQAKVLEYISGQEKLKHEDRIKALEQFKNWGSGAIAAVGALIGYKVKDAP